MTKPRQRKKTPSQKGSSGNRGPRDPVSVYARGVVAGRIVAGPHVRNTCARHLKDLKDAGKRGLKFDKNAAQRAMDFFEIILRLIGGQFEGIPFKLEPSQKFIVGSLFGWKRLDGTRRFRRAYIEEGKGNGKALATDTPIPTPEGWTTMGEIEVGDMVFDDAGKPTRVKIKSPVRINHRCYRVSFDDGSSIVADADHLWFTEKRRSGFPKGGALRGRTRVSQGDWRKAIRTTEEIRKTLRYKNGKHKSANHSIPLGGALGSKEIGGPIPAYTLGAWLGDGDSDQPRITISEKDDEIRDRISTDGYRLRAVKSTNRTQRYYISDHHSTGEPLLFWLQAKRLLKNKHIPEGYLRTGIRDRLDLLRGLMDTDGYINGETGQAEFTTIRKNLADSVHELVVSLGYKATLIEGRATLYGKDCGPKYRVFFFPTPDRNPFHLPRKASLVKERHSRRSLSGERRIISVVPVDSVPVCCIGIESESHLFLAGRAMIPTHNTPLAAGIGLYMMTADSEPRAEVYAAASKRDQAMVMFRDATAMVQQSPELSNIITTSGINPIWNLLHNDSGSFFRPIASEDGQSGPRPSCALCDEVHEHRDGVVIEMLERGFKFRRQPLLLMITNSGSSRQSVCWQEHSHAVRVANGDTVDDNSFSYVCALDDGDDPLEDPSCWRKVNPLLGVSITEDYLSDVVKQAKGIPGKLNGILRLHFCVWTDSEQAWLPADTWRGCEDELMVMEEFAGQEMWVGLDLSSSKDLTAASYVFRDGTADVEMVDGEVKTLPCFAAFTEFWTPGDTMLERALIDQAPYDTWAKEGHLFAPEGKLIRYDHVAARLIELSVKFEIKVLSYDRYLINRFEEELDAMGVSLPLIEHPQGWSRRKDTPLWMPQSILDLEDAILENRFRTHINPVLRYCVSSACFITSAAGLRRFSKQRATGRIDGAVSLAMAVGAAIAADHIVETPSTYEGEFYI